MLSRRPFTPAAGFQFGLPPALRDAGLPSDIWGRDACCRAILDLVSFGGPSAFLALGPSMGCIGTTSNWGYFFRRASISMTL